MTLKVELEKIEDAPEAVRSFYEEKDGKFRLKLDGLEDTSGLKKKNAELLAESKAAKAAAKAAEDAREAAALEAAQKSGDSATLRTSYEKKIADTEAAHKAALAERDGHVTALTVGQTALALSAALAIPGSSDVLLPHIRQRLSVEYRDGVPVTVVLDASGKPSAMTVEELKAEFLANAAFAPLLVGSKASGGSATGGGRGGAAAKSVSRTVFDGMSPGDRMAHIKEGGKVTG